ncbi:hypothetical protein DKAM_1449 [Desulfurococcus amylolyticus 1221n]|uniref:Uncharacterized protein n=1 Tax=Desulfurococcus amylolyticus (strain DSM 18924 / JCM 16383 / VKM B-2413 / 1221n) TaxID=490899 RepID=B8D6P4_DESA1|nr:hypothetical protein [Desulfurococcus amylolyticus]ACL11775.1 hypothetical protein DKAM_1449 [Desulfurococcus amylolyticus 1221n]
MINCGLLETIKNISRESGFTVAELLVVMLGMHKEGLGRASVSRKTSIGERRIRRINEYVKSLQKTRPELYEFITEGIHQASIITQPVKQYLLTIFHPVDPDLLKKVESKIVEIRDWIIVETRDRECIEVIGIVPDRIVFPLVPEELSRRYIELVPATLLENNSVLVLWRKHIPLLYESAVLNALVNICTESMI